MSYLSEIHSFVYSLSYQDAPSSYDGAAKQFKDCQDLVPRIKKILSGECLQGATPDQVEQFRPGLQKALEIAYSRGELKKGKIHTYHQDQMHYWYYCGYEMDRKCVKKGLGISH